MRRRGARSARAGPRLAAWTAAALALGACVLRPVAAGAPEATVVVEEKEKKSEGSVEAAKEKDAGGEKDEKKQEEKKQEDEKKDEKKQEDKADADKKGELEKRIADLEEQLSKGPSAKEEAKQNATTAIAAPVEKKKEEVFISEAMRLDSEVSDIQWFLEDDSALLLLTQRGTLYRSADHGKTWKNYMKKLAESLGGSSSSQPMSITRLINSPASKWMVAVSAKVAGTEGKVHSFVSRNGGESWKLLDVAFPIQSWVFHPTRDEWALVSYWNEFCKSGGAKIGHGECSHDLYVTKDFGRSLQLVMRRVVQFSWGSTVHGHEDRIYFTHFRNKHSGPQPRLTRWMFGVDLARTDDFGATEPRTLVKAGNKFQLSNEYILVVKAKNAERQEVVLEVSNNGGDSFTETVMPHHLKQRSYSLLDTSEGAVVVHVNHGGDMGDIYISDKAGVQYTVSLENNVRMRGLCSFEKVMNLRGIYIANIIEHGDKVREQEIKAEMAANHGRTTTASPSEEFGAEGAADQTQAERMIRSLSALAEEEEDIGDLTHGAEGEAVLSRDDHMARQASKAQARRHGLLDLAGHAEGVAAELQPRGRMLAEDTRKYRTVISFDMGGAWQDLAPPAKDVDGKALHCPNKDCHLHLHSYVEMVIHDFAPVYSYRNAIGILMGSGNVGSSLSMDRRKVSTYMSRDGGIHWQEVRKGTFIYEYGNHGALVVLAELGKDSKKLWYSSNEGHSWEEIEMPGSNFRVSNVLIERDARSRKFLVYGKHGSEGIVHYVDFTGLHQRNCSGAATVNTKDSDYEYWTPSDNDHHRGCIMGHKTIYRRRKQLAKCSNDNAMEVAKFQKNCECTKENYECAVGFERNIGSLKCIVDATTRAYSRAPSELECQRTGNFKVDAYRRVPGDTCEKGWVPEQVSLPCRQPQLQMPGSQEAQEYHYSGGPAGEFLHRPAAAAPLASPTRAVAAGVVAIVLSVGLFVSFRQRIARFLDARGLNLAGWPSARSKTGYGRYVDAEMVGSSAGPGGGYVAASF